MVDKALHVLWRIAEEQPHLVGKLPALPEAADQLGHAAPAAAAGIACLRQNALGQPVLQIAVQHGGTVEIQQRLPALEADGQQAQSLGRQQPVQPPHVVQQRLPVIAGAGEQTARFDARQRGRALPDKDLLRHAVPPFVPPNSMPQPAVIYVSVNLF